MDGPPAYDLSRLEQRERNHMSWGGKRAGAGRKPKNSAFEGAPEQYGRTFIYMPGDSKTEMGSYDRCRLLEKSRWFVNNFGQAARGIKGVASYVTGKGICVQARTKKREWNQETEEAFEAKCGTNAFGFDVAGQVNFYEAQNLIVEQMMTDGDFFMQLLKSRTGAGMAYFVSGEYCQSPWNEKEGFYDGVKTNKLGRPTAYKFLTDYEKPNDYTVIPAEDIIHFKRIHRHGFVRGVPALCHAINHLHDMTDILAFTKGSFKLASQIALIIESAEAGKMGLESHLQRVSVTNSSGTTTDVSHDKMYPLAGHVNLKPGEKISQLRNEHPGSAFEPFMRYLTRDIAWGIGISPELLWDITETGGANVRLVLASDQIFFEKLQQLLINQFCRRFYVYWLWREIEAGRISYPGEDWWRHDWLTPSKLTVDFTKDGKLLADLVDRGLLSPERYYGMQGLDAETEELDVIRRRARRKAMVEEIAAEEGVELTVQECFPPPPGATYAQPIGQEDVEEEEVDTSKKK
jgi:lambda family phage portal protein